KLTDARGSRRSLVVVDVTDEGCWTELNQTAYIIPNTILRRSRRMAKGLDREASVGELPPRANALELDSNDLLVLTRDQKPGRPATRDSQGGVLTPATIGCTIPEVFDNVRSGESIWFDDGKIGGVIERVQTDRIVVRITQTRLGGGKLQADKGINLPESQLSL